MIWNIVTNKNSEVLYVIVCLKMWAVAHERSSSYFVCLFYYVLFNLVSIGVCYA